VRERERKRARERERQRERKREGKRESEKERTEMVFYREVMSERECGRIQIMHTQMHGLKYDIEIQGGEDP